MSSELTLWRSVADACGATYPLVRSYVAALESGCDSGTTFRNYWSMRSAHIMAGKPFEDDDYFETTSGVVISMATVAEHCDSLNDLLAAYNAAAQTAPVFDCPTLQGFLDTVMQSELLQDIHTEVAASGDSANLLNIISHNIGKHDDFIKRFSGDIIDYLETMPMDELAQMMELIKEMTGQGGDELIQAIMAHAPV
ncbi:hypothetical protein [Red seabream iridovirus]|uniref:ORF16L n=1 Tax=Turbot reddish body iridovirus TaxID=273651 RepID=E2CTW1_ISKNV|nr:ORF16L [Turbot reddish body iridovirus]UNA01221.1 hypothetical protein [Red seabream iridovirus]